MQTVLEVPVHTTPEHPSPPRSENVLEPRRPKAGNRKPMVVPFARALSLLGAFRSDERWLGNSELAARTQLPTSTVTRMSQSLVTLGYMRYGADNRKFCLTPAVLALGYGAIANSGIHRFAGGRMRLMAEHHRVHVSLSTRDRLDLVVIDSCLTSAMPASLQLDIGARMGLANTAAGWTMLASLPDIERFYLLQSVEHRAPRDWPRLRRLSNDAILQVQQRGYCLSASAAGQPLTVVAAPIRLPGRAPLVVTCMGPGATLGRARVERELGPALLRVAGEIEQEGADA